MRLRWVLGGLLLGVLAAQPAEARPASKLTVDSLLDLPFVVHAPSGQRAAAEAVRDVVDWAWQQEITLGGWPAPPPDSAGPDERFDIYLDPSLAEDEAYVEPENELDLPDRYAMTSFMAVPVTFASDGARRSIVAHELNHASQFAIDAAESDAFFEHTAVFVERRVANEPDTYGIGIADFQAHPERGLTYLVDDYYEYGAALWLFFLSDYLDQGGAQLVQRLWLDSRQPTATNAPSFLDSLDGILAERSLTRAALFATFAIWRWSWPSAPLVATLPLQPGANSATLGSFGARLFLLDGVAGSIDVHLDDPEAAVGIQGRSASGALFGEPIVVRGSGSHAVVVPEGSAQLLVALVWVPPTGGLDFLPTRTLSVTITTGAIVPDLAPPATVDGGAADATDGADAAKSPGHGSGCATASSPESSALFVLLFGLLLALSGRAAASVRARRGPRPAP